MLDYIREHSTHLVYWIDYLALYSLSGLLLVRLWLIPKNAAALAEFTARWRRARKLALATLLSMSAPILIANIVEMTGTGLLAAIGRTPLILTQTFHGWVWLLRVAALICLLLISAPPPSGITSRRRAAMALVCCAILAFTYSATSHSARDGSLSPAALVHWGHVLFGLLWAGAILSFTTVVLPSLRAENQRALLADCARRLSRLAAASFGVVLLTGAYTAWQMLESPTALLETDYGRTLAAKLLFVAAMLAIAWAQRFVIIPRLVEHAPAERHLRKGMALDEWAVWLVLLFAADLAHEIPPRDAQYARASDATVWIEDRPPTVSMSVSDFGQGMVLTAAVATY